MGWLFSTGWQTKSDLIKHLCEDNGITTLAKCVRGNVLYTVHVQYNKADAPENRFIGVYLLGSNNKHGEGWGYKDMCESMHPYNYDCPLKYFEMVPKAECEEWRAKCHMVAARKAIKIKRGDTIKLRAGCSPSELVVVEVKPLRAEAHGSVYRVARRYIAEVVSCATK